MLCDYVTRGYGDHPRFADGEEEVLGVVPLLCAQGREEEAQISLVAPEDVGPAEAEAVILPRTPDEPLVFDVARGLDGGSMIEQTHQKFWCLVLTFCINSTRQGLVFFFFLLLLELIMLCDYITRGYGDHPPLTIVVPRGSRPKEGVTHGGRGR